MSAEFFIMSAELFS